jgi:hypothetical protein
MVLWSYSVRKVVLPDLYHQPTPVLLTPSCQEPADGFKVVEM